MAIADFDEIRFPEKIALSVTGGPEFLTTITSTVGGHEQRNINWEEARRRYRVEHDLQDQALTDALLNFFTARRGMAVGFRFRDWVDYASDMPALITNPLADSGDDTLPAASAMTPQKVQNTVAPTTFAGDAAGTLIFQLVKVYPATVGEDYVQKIRKPVGTTSANTIVRVFVGGSEIDETTDFTIDPTTGIITLLADPGDGVLVTADYLYDVPVRFNVDVASITKRSFDLNAWSGIELVELRIS